MWKRLFPVVALFVAIQLTPGAQAQSICLNCHFTFSNGMHARGVGECNMCHTMHNSVDGTLVDPDSPNGNEFLLNDDAPSDVCLRCHTGFVSMTFAEDPSNPPREIGAGNFTFLLEDNINDGPGGGMAPLPGYVAGHSILAPSRGLVPDGSLATSPGGTFPASQLGCTSCHDPHGNGHFRILNGSGQVQNGLFTFVNDAPAAEGLSIYHGSERVGRHTAYNSGVSAWCGNCHGDIHETGGKFIHPTNVALGPEIAQNYNLYNGALDPTGGTSSTAYLAAVPFEDPAVLYTGTEGPTGTSRVMCLSCHRAHASSAPDSGRWDFNVTFLSDDGVESGSYPLPNPYGTTAQRSLCNKCHLKDEFDGIP